MSKLVTIAVLQDAINNLGLPEKITRTQLEYWRAGSRAVIRALNEAIQAAPSVSGGAQSDQKQPESRSNTRLGGGAQACPEGGFLPTALINMEVLTHTEARSVLLQNQQQIIPDAQEVMQACVAPMSDKPPCGVQNADFEGQAQRNVDKVDALLGRIDVFQDSNEIAGALRKISQFVPGDCEAYWLEEAATHIQCQHDLLVEIRDAMQQEGQS